MGRVTLSSICGLCNNKAHMAEGPSQVAEAELQQARRRFLGPTEQALSHAANPDSYEGLPMRSGLRGKAEGAMLRTVMASTVVPENSIARYVPPATPISPITCRQKGHMAAR